MAGKAEVASVDDVPPQGAVARKAEARVSFAPLGERSAHQVRRFAAAEAAQRTPSRAPDNLLANVGKLPANAQALVDNYSRTQQRSSIVRRPQPSAATFDDKGENPETCDADLVLGFLKETILIMTTASELIPGGPFIAKLLRCCKQIDADVIRSALPQRMITLTTLISMLLSLHNIIGAKKIEYETPGADVDPVMLEAVHQFDFSVIMRMKLITSELHRAAVHLTAKTANHPADLAGIPTTTAPVVASHHVASSSAGSGGGAERSTSSTPLRHRGNAAYPLKGPGGGDWRSWQVAGDWRTWQVADDPKGGDSLESKFDVAGDINATTGVISSSSGVISSSSGGSPPRPL